MPLPQAGELCFQSSPAPNPACASGPARAPEALLKGAALSGHPSLEYSAVPLGQKAGWKYPGAGASKSILLLATLKLESNT